LNSKNKKNIYKEIFSYILVAIIGALLAVMLRIFVIEPYIVPTSSMSPTLVIGDKVIVNKIAYKFKDIQRGDVIALHSPFDEKYLVKRIIGIPHDEISFSEQNGIYINGEIFDEPYLPEDLYPSYENDYIIIGEEEYFVMGDNRNNSSDSRLFGTIKYSDIFGEVIFIYGPVSRIGRIN